jgi:hypothetical protein
LAIVVLSILLVVVALVALSAFGLLLILARRLRNLEERVNLIVTYDPGTLPDPGTPLPPFEAITTDGRPVSDRDFAVGERIFALLSTGCGDCITAAAEFRQHAGTLSAPPVVGVIGPPEDRAPIMALLEDHVQVLAETTLDPVAEALQIRDYPSVLLVRDGVIEFAEHALAPVLAQLATPAAAPTGARR